MILIFKLWCWVCFVKCLVIFGKIVLCKMSSCLFCILLNILFVIWLNEWMFGLRNLLIGVLIVKMMIFCFEIVFGFVVGLIVLVLINLGSNLLVLIFRNGILVLVIWVFCFLFELIKVIWVLCFVSCIFNGKFMWL